MAAGNRVRGGRHGARGWFALLDELHDVHGALGLRQGYVLVGHSVGGLVLVDPAHEDMPERARHGMPGDAWEAWTTGRLGPNPDGVREIELARHARRGRLPDIPVTVITATVREDGNGFDARFLQEAARRVHASILDGVRQARHVPASGSGHDLPHEAPDLVASENTRMVRLTGSDR